MVDTLVTHCYAISVELKGKPFIIAVDYDKMLKREEQCMLDSDVGSLTEPEVSEPIADPGKRKRSAKFPWYVTFI